MILNHLRCFAFLAVLSLPLLAFGQQKSSDPKSTAQAPERKVIDLSPRECTSLEMKQIQEKGLTILSKTQPNSEKQLRWSDGQFGEVSCNGTSTKIVYSPPGVVGHGTLCIACFEDSKLLHTGACRDLPAGFWKPGN